MGIGDAASIVPATSIGIWAADDLHIGTVAMRCGGAVVMSVVPKG